MSSNTALKETGTVRLASEFDSYGAVPALIAEVFEEIGGKQALIEFAADNQRWFYTHMFKAAPSLAPVTGVQGEVNIVINNHLGMTELDIEGEVIDG